MAGRWSRVPAVGLLDKLLGRGAAHAPRAEVRALFDELIERAHARAAEGVTPGLDAAAAIFELPPDARLEALRLSLDFPNDFAAGGFSDRFGNAVRAYGFGDFHLPDIARRLSARLLDGDLPLTGDDLADLVRTALRDHDREPLRRVLGAVERHLGGTPATGALKKALERVLVEVKGGKSSPAARIRRRVADALGMPAPDPAALSPVDAWTHALLAHLEATPGLDDAAKPLLAFATTATSARPSRKWLKAAGELIEGLGVERHRALVGTALEAAGTKAPGPVRVPSSYVRSGFTDGDAALVAEEFADMLRGLAWSAAAGDAAALVPALGDAAERCFKKLPEHGPLSPKIGNACLAALGEIGTPEAIGRLSRLKTRVKHASSRAQVHKTLAKAAEKLGMSAAELEEIGVPTLGLTGIGVRVATVGDLEAEIRLRPATTPELTWQRGNGKRQKTIPAEVKRDHPEALAELKRTVAELKKLVPAQAARIERDLAAPRTLPYATWRERYADHPVVGFLARRLVWWVGETLAGFDGEALVDVAGDPLSPSSDTPVRLWHPIESPADTVRAWREALDARGITQPFKQAHREIYVLTDAERETDSYSNRFAAHILRQHVFHALCREREWHYTLQGQWDSHNTPWRDLPGGFRVEYWVDPAPGLVDVTSSGVFLYLATDQVRFYQTTENGPLPLTDVPPLLFSEGMRDVDLFVGVSSVGNDPTWQDGGPNGRYADYWADYAFGELGESAKSRREALERILPRLKIADRCTLEDRFLVVRGDLRTYRIHLGSANIRMTPNDQYLCIVPSHKETRLGVALPFEGDHVLSIILSKALLLAADTKIRDRTIVSQIQKH